MKIPFKVGDHVYSTRSGLYVGEVIEVHEFGKTMKNEIRAGRYYLIIKDPLDGAYAWNEKEIKERGFFK